MSSPQLMVQLWHWSYSPSPKMRLYLLVSPLHYPFQRSRWCFQLYHLSQPIPQLSSYLPNPFSALMPSGTTNYSCLRVTVFQVTHYSTFSCLFPLSLWPPLSFISVFLFILFSLCCSSSPLVSLPPS